MPIEQLLPGSDGATEKADVPLTERAAQQYRDSVKQSGESPEASRDYSRETLTLLEHCEAISNSWFVMPECPMKELLFPLAGGMSIEHKTTSTPRWALTKKKSEAISRILGVTEREIGIREFGGDVLSERHPHSTDTHYLDNPLPVVLLLRSRIDQASRAAIRSPGHRAAVGTSRDGAEGRDRQEDEKKIQSMLDEINGWYK